MSVSVMELVNAYYQTALDYHSGRLFNSSRHYDDDVTSRIAKMMQRLEAQLKSQMFNGSEPFSIFVSLPALQVA